MLDLGSLSLKIKVDGADAAKTKIGGVKAFAAKAGAGLKNAAIGMTKAVASATVAATAAAGTAIVGITKKAIDNYAEYEQLVGGVETLFKDSADIVKGYAETAYKDAGLSANQYMETVTSFSASLIASVGGDTEKAAEYANMAIIDMSDNANKMGSSMESIQNAYNGFAKQNYTMLDNLKLGYGGTNAEMERLIADAAAMTDVQQKLGVTVDASSMSFDNIAAAIHVVQANMGIAGATAAEASDTIEGSVNTMKAAWENLTTGLGNENADMEKLMDEFVESVENVAKNIMPILEDALEGAGKLIDDLLPVVLEKVPEWVANYLPKILQSGIDILMTLIDGIVSDPDALIDAILKCLDILIDAIVNNLPEFLAKGVLIIMKLLEGIIQASAKLFAEMPKLIADIIKIFWEHRGDFLQAGKDLLSAWWEGMKSVWHGVIDWVSDKIDWMKEKLSDALSFGRRAEKKGGSHRTGLREVPYDGYIAELHKGEKVLTAAEADRYEDGGGGNGSIVNNITVNNYSPEALDEAKTARLYRQSQRQLALGF